VIFSKTVSKPNPLQNIFRIITTHMFNPKTVKHHLTYKLYRKIRRKYVVRKINGFHMALNMHDEGICKDLFLFGIREPYTTQYLQTQHVLHKGDVVFDVGANIGYYVLLEAGLIGENGCVHAFEPVTENYLLLMQNLKLNHIGNVETWPFAVGEQISLKTVYITEKMNLSTLLPSGIQVQIKDKMLVPVFPLDFFTRKFKPPNMVRMDVEGYEYYILKGMKETLKYHPKLLIEIHSYLLNKKQLDTIFNILEEHGYTPQFAVKEEYCTTKTAKIFNPELKRIKINIHSLKQLRTFMSNHKITLITLLT